jgi:hypothetical protein
MNLFESCAECHGSPPDLRTRPCPWCGLELGRCCLLQHTRERNRNDPKHPGVCRLVRDIAEGHARVQWAMRGSEGPLAITEHDWLFGRLAVAYTHVLVNEMLAEHDGC